MTLWPAWLRLIRREDERRRGEMEHREMVRERAEYERKIAELREQRDLETKRVHALDEERHALGHQVEALEAENERLRGLLREMTASLETQTRQSAEIVAESAKRRAEREAVRPVEPERVRAIARAEIPEALRRVLSQRETMTTTKDGA